jgi:hypothetical protein
MASESGKVLVELTAAGWHRQGGLRGKSAMGQGVVMAIGLSD